MDATAYLIGSAVLLAVGAALAFSAFVVRRRLVPVWPSGPARLAEIVLASSVFVVSAELVGAVGLLDQAALAITIIALSGILVLLTRLGSAPTEPPQELPPPPRSRRIELVAATFAVALVGAQWAGKIGYAYAHGMTHPDTVAYHGSNAAWFVERGHLLRHLDPTYALHDYGGQTSELIHAAFAVLVGTDIVSPLVNLGVAAIAILAAWCLGRRHGLGALCVLGAALVAGLPIVAATHPGQASNDLAIGAFVLAAIALLVEGEFAVAPTAGAALAAGLALGIKLTGVASVGVLAIGVIVLAFRRRRPRVALAWCAALFATGSFWFFRDTVIAHNPLPFYSLHLGPFTLSEVPNRQGDAISKYFFDGDVWTSWFLPGLRVAFGRGWPVVVALAIAGPILGLRRKQPPLVRLGALALLAGLIAYLFTPNTADGRGLGFVFSTRYALPALLGAVVYFPLALATASSRLRTITAAVIAALVLVDATAANNERVPAWPHAAWVLGPLAALAIVGAAAWWYFATPRASRSRVAAIVGIAAILIVAVGWPVQRNYFEHRYLRTGLPLDVVNGAFRDIHGKRVAFWGTAEAYPFFGTDLSNDLVRFAGPQTGTDAQRCRAWMDQLRGFDYVVIAHQPFFDEGPPEDALRADRGIKEIAGDPVATLYQEVGALAGNGCSG